MLKSNSLIVEIGGSIRRISMEDFETAMNEGQAELLHQVAWGFPLKDATQTSPAWGMIGNIAAYNSYKAKVGRSLMDANGRAAKLHKNNSGVFADGTTLDETKGSVVVIAPRLYYLVVTDAETSIPYLWCSEFPISGHYLANADNGNRMVIGAYKGSLASGKLVSRSGVTFDTSSKTISAYFSAAQSFGANWGLKDYDCLRWFEIMCLSEAQGNANAQASLGQGVGGSTGLSWDTVNTSTVLKTTGLTKGLGDASGTVAIASGANANSTHVSVLGIEDWWNLQWEFVQGIFFGNSGNSGQDGDEVYIYKGNRLPSSSELASHPDGEFRELTRLATSGYVKVMTKGEYFDMIATSVTGGDSNKSWSDYFYGNATGQVCLVGGPSNYGSESGPLCVNSDHAWSNASSIIGARPAYYGPVTIVDGADL
jgi:hypothetical protein